MTPETPTPTPVAEPVPPPVESPYAQLSLRCLLNHPWKVVEYSVSGTTRTLTGRIYHFSNYKIGESTVLDRNSALDMKRRRHDPQGESAVGNPQRVWFVYHVDEMVQ